MILQTGLELASAVGLSRGARVALIGGGGKTTAMLALARALSRDLSVLVTTTTKLWPPPLPVIFNPAVAGAALAHANPVALGSGYTLDGKLLGIPPESVGELPADIVLCEADGSKGRSLKVHASHEPLVPGGTTHVLLLVGADAINAPASAAVIHRFQLSGRSAGVALTPPIVAGFIVRMMSRLPAGPEVHVLINKADLNPGGAAELFALIGNVPAYLTSLRNA